MKFKDRVAIVTGGSEGIGFGISKALARKGAKVYIVARTLDKLKTAREEIEKSGGRAEIRTADIADIDRMREIIDEVYAKESGLHIFVNNAGAYRAVSIDMPFEEIMQKQKAIRELDEDAPYAISLYLAKKFIPLSAANLKILTVNSQAGLRVFPYGLGYGVAKTALVSGLMHLEKELKDRKNQNISFYRLYPGTVGTEKTLQDIRNGTLQNPTTLESVVETAIDLLTNSTPTRDAYVGYIPGEGITRRYFQSDPDKFKTLDEIGKEVVDPHFNPKAHFK